MTIDVETTKLLWSPTFEREQKKIFFLLLPFALWYHKSLLLNVHITGEREKSEKRQSECNKDIAMQ